VRFLLVLADQANLALLDTAPVYPGAASPNMTTSGTADVRFASRDRTLPVDATQTAVGVRGRVLEGIANSKGA
jgi:hypothetical protein